MPSISSGKVLFAFVPFSSASLFFLLMVHIYLHVMTKETFPTSTVSSNSSATMNTAQPTTTSPRWMSRLMCKSSPLICRQSPPTFSVASITKVHTFGKIKQQSNSCNNLVNRKDGCGMDTNTNKALLRQHHLHEKKSINTKKSRESIFGKLPVELIQDIFTRLDCLALYQLSLTCHAFRHLLLKTPTSRTGFFIWRTLMVDSTLPNQNALGLYQLVAFLVMGRIHNQVDFMVLSGCTYLDPPLLDTMIRAFSALTRLSVVNCPQIDCWQILHILKSSIKCNRQSTPMKQSNSELLTALKKIRHTIPKSTQLSKTEPTTSSVAQTALLNLAATTETSTTATSTTTSDDPSPLSCLTHLTHLNIQGAFPSERSYKSYGHEMYCFGEIKRALLQLSHDEPGHYQQLSEGHYALYQFWLLLRSHMLRWDDPSDPRRTEFRPPWLPDTLIQFIQITEQQQQQQQHQQQDAGFIQLDLTPCPLCHRNVATTTNHTCSTCQAPARMVCAQCRCHSCHAILCTRCHHNQQTQFRQTTLQQQQQIIRNGFDNQDVLALWRVIRCQQCHLPRRTCGQPLCVYENQQRWICTTCQQQWGRNRKLSLSPRLFKKSRHWSHWI